MGAGIGGLTAAFELIQKGFNVTLIERNSSVGGLARSKESIADKICPEEYSWRAFGLYYHNIFNILKKIPIKNGTVFDNLTKLINTDDISNCNKNNQLTVKPNSPPLNDKLILLDKALKHYMSCDNRNIDTHSNENWNDYLQSKNISQTTYNQYVRSLGPLFGFDNEKASTYDVCRQSEIMIDDFVKNGEHYSITKIPTNTAWFDPWVILLRKLGVNLLLNTTISKINIHNGRITSIEANGAKLNADYFVCALSLETAVELVNRDLYMIPSLQKLNLLYKYGRQIQLSVQMYFDRRAYFKITSDYLYLENAPWGVIILDEGSIWQKNINLEDYCDKKVRAIWSIGICETHKPGLLIKKPFVDCTKDEIQKEVWYQITHEPNIEESICVESFDTSEKSSINDIKILDFKMWDSFKFETDPSKPGYMHMDTSEPKFANNTYTKQYRPKTRTDIPNFYFATAYCDTSVGVHSMEGAAESGKKAAIAIVEDEKLLNDIYVYEHGRILPVVFAPLRAVDSVLYSVGAPHISSLTFGYSFVILLIYIIIVAMCLYYVVPKILNVLASK